MPNSTTSARQRIRQLKEAESSEIDTLLKAFAACWCGFSSEHVLFVLTHTSELSFHDAFNRMTAAGFRTGPWLLTKDTLSGTKPLTLPDFELAFSMWKKLEDDMQSLLSVRFVKYWQSLEGGALTGETLLNLKPLWQHTPPTQSRRLSPSRVCGLGWASEEMVALLDSHVDLNGDTQDLVRELLARGMLTPVLLQNVGLIGGLLWVDSRLAAERLLAGDLPALESGTPQATIARAMLSALAAWDKEFTAQNVKHLLCFVQTLSLHLSKCSNAMYVAMDALTSVVARVAPEDRGTLVKTASLVYLETPAEPTGRPGSALRESRVAEIARPDGPWLTNRSVSFLSFEGFLVSATRFLSLKELTESVEPVAKFAVSAPFQAAFFEWASVQLDVKQDAFTLRDFLRKWLVLLCSPDQVLAWWGKAVDTVNSWSFTVGTVPEVVGGCTAVAGATEDAEADPIALQVGLIVLRKLEDESALQRKRCSPAVYLRLAEYFPKLVVQQVGITRWIALSKKRSPTFNIVRRETYKLSAGALQINDAMRPETELAKVLAEHPTMQKSKTKEEFALLTDWVNNLEFHLYSQAELVERMSELLCATWADKAALLQLCGTFVSKLLDLAKLSDTASASLIKFVKKCPNLGSKQDFMVRQLAAFAQARAGGRVGTAELAALAPVLAAVASKVASLIEMLHALGCEKVDDAATQALFYRLLGEEEKRESQVFALKGCAFSTPPLDAPDECVESELLEALSETAPSGGTVDALSAESSGFASELPSVPLAPSCGIYARFGEAGEATLRAYLKEASPKSLANVLDDSDGAKFRKLCAVVIRAWAPSECKPEEVEALLEVISWFPELRERCADLVFDAGDEAHVRQLMVGVRPDLDELPRKWWGCVHWPSCKAADIARLVAANITVPLENVGLAEREWETQQLLLEAHRDDLGGLVDYAPEVEGPIGGYLERIFELIPASTKLLTEMGDGVEDEERLSSGWNKMINRLLAALKQRIRAGNVLHTDEQLLLFGGCAQRLADSANSTLLADLMESKFVDPNHIAALVKYVLGCKYVPGVSGLLHVVRDSALRAMMRLQKEERDELHRTLLEGRTGPLPMQVLFSLVVTQLDASVKPLVVRQLDMLVEEGSDAPSWEQLLLLIRDANPADASKPPHTFPRSLGAWFGERFLQRYLKDDPHTPSPFTPRDLRFFTLFVACTPPARIPRYVISMLTGQRFIASGAQTELVFLNALTSFTRDEFQEIVEFFRPEEWSRRLDWVLTQVVDGPNDTCEMLRTVLDVLGRPCFRDQLIPLLMSALTTKQMREVALHNAEVRFLLRQRMPKAESSGAARTLWMHYFREAWRAGAQYTPAELKRDAHLTDKTPLTNGEIELLGVDVPSYKLLVGLYPGRALLLFGFKIIEHEPAFAKSLSEAQLRTIRQLWDRSDAHWATCRVVIGHVEPAIGLQLAITLFKSSRELPDLELIKKAFHAVDSFTRKQVWLPNELGPDLWAKFRQELQKEVVDGAVPRAATLNGIFADGVPTL